MVKWRKRIGEGSYRHILNTSHQFQMKVVLGIPFNNLCMVISYVHTSIHLPAICVSVMHSTFIVNQYMALFYFVLYIAWVTWGCARVCGVEVFCSVQMFWLINVQRVVHMITFPSSLCNGESKYDWSLWLDFGSSNYIPLGTYHVNNYIYIVFTGRMLSMYDTMILFAYNYAYHPQVQGETSWRDHTRKAHCNTCVPCSPISLAYC